MKKKKFKINRYPYAKEQLRIYNEAQKKHSLDHLYSRGRLISFYILVALSVALSALYAVFRCGLAYQRLFTSIRDFGISFAYYLTWFIPMDITPTVNEIPDISLDTFLPNTLEQFQDKFSRLFGAIFNRDNFLGYVSSNAVTISNIAKIVTLVIPLTFAIRILVDKVIDKRNVDFNIKTKPMKLYDKILDKAYYPVKRYIQDFIQFNAGHYFIELLLFIWLCNLNICTVIVGFLAWYIYFARAFTFLNVYIQIVKLTIDIGIFLKCSFLALTLGVAYFAFNKWRANVAYDTLNRLEEKVEKKVAEFPIAVYMTGPPGAKKTSSLVNTALTQSIRYRNQALKSLFKYFRFFPDFPWLRLEKRLVRQMKIHEIYNLATIEKAYDPKRYDFDGKEWLYDINKYRTVYNDGINDIHISKAIETYAKLFFIYVMETSLIVSNFPVREDYMIENCGNFVLYDTDFYSHPVTEEYSRFSHIINYDILRLGKTISSDPKYRNSFEFGILVFDEFGKERGNNLENLTVKKNADECNVKNDLLTWKLKFGRHPAVVDNFCYCTWFLDEQRVTSLGADIRDCCDTIVISNKEKQKLAYPMYYVESLLYDWLMFMFFPIFKRYRFSHGNKTLSGYLVKHIIINPINHIEKKLNRYSYKVISYTRFNMASENEKKEESIPLVPLKVYKTRYATDTRKNFFRQRALKSEYGLNDYPCYTDIDATDEQLHSQNSHMINEQDRLNQIAEKGD